jgi:hypothetical protein
VIGKIKSYFKWTITLPAQPVDATLSNPLIHKYFSGRIDLFGCDGQNQARATFQLI